MCPPNNATLNEWLGYIEAIHPTEIDMGLDRLKTVLAQLLPEPTNAFVFTVAGTNGKGTTVAALNALALGAGQTVGQYSSPHLLRFNERIRINNVPATDEQLVEAFAAVEQARQATQMSLSYFEFTTLAAFYLFQQLELSVWVLEIGLGGRLDAVNIIEPDISVVTTIGLDHEAFLGSDINQIGIEKASICRADKPLVLGSENMPDSVQQTARKVGAHLYPFNQQHGIKTDSLYWQDGICSRSALNIPAANAASALQAFALSPFALNAEQAQDIIAQVQVAGRLQQALYHDHALIMDVGHNPHAAGYIATALAAQRYHIVLGMLKDKDSRGFANALAPIAGSYHCIGLDVPRGFSAEQLAQSLEQKSQVHHSLAEALAAIHQQYPDEPIFIGGSFYTVAQALTLLEG
ncbi:bifunctional folylpolyglutamate synthase/dihydrofolate synthase [Reinekea thalattae]|uniref:Dihydrofolate synthase/folylpolyglutamate synthase n=1 Tax=Reinekea thalattae TaxID=2593301 RepID=A0A5C8Z8V1_9GAMM|nr:bifunctional tetrahydrofolate synthase/dihydrofolate synthase [Reinekea thalattae]TXR53698.1 bifunctional tetrahydrofolate synthase/dihydrofolate synthase [Reinekea thalattae]